MQIQLRGGGGNQQQHQKWTLNNKVPARTREDNKSTNHCSGDIALSPRAGSRRHSVWARGPQRRGTGGSPPQPRWRHSQWRCAGAGPRPPAIGRGQLFFCNEVSGGLSVVCPPRRQRRSEEGEGRRTHEWEDVLCLLCCCVAAFCSYCYSPQQRKRRIEDTASLCQRYNRQYCCSCGRRSCERL